jgi:hypothetical protein
MKCKNETYTRNKVGVLVPQRLPSQASFTVIVTLISSSGSKLDLAAVRELRSMAPSPEICVH